MLTSCCLSSLSLTLSLSLQVAVGKKVDLSLVLPDAMYDEMSSLLGQIDEVLSRWAASAPVEKRNRLNEKRGGDIITVSKGTQHTENVP